MCDGVESVQPVRLAFSFLCRLTLSAGALRSPMDPIQYEGVDVWYRRMKATRHITEKSEAREYPAACAASGAGIREGDEVYLVLCNWALFDNCWVLASEVGQHGWEPCLRAVVGRYREHVRLYLASLPYRHAFGSHPHALVATAQPVPLAPKEPRREEDSREEAAVVEAPLAVEPAREGPARPAEVGRAPPRDPLG